MITTVNSTTSLLSALKVAHAGDTIQLASGVYSGVSISDLHFTTDVTITSADPLHEAVLTGLAVKNTSGLTFRDVDFKVATGTTTNAGIQVSSSQDIHFDKVHVHGSLDNNASNDCAGMLLRSSSDISVTNSEFEQVYWGVAHLNDDGLTVSGNQFHDVRVDGVRGGGSSNVTVSGNHFWNFRPTSTDHGDGVQFWTTNTTASVHNIVVTDNLMERGDGGIFQGVFVSDKSGALPFLHLVIRHNAILGGMYNGINVGGANDVDIEGNIVQGFTDMKSWIRLNDIDGITLASNKANTFLIGTTVTHLTNTGNEVIPLASDGGAAMLALWEGSTSLDTSSTGGGGVFLTGTDNADTLTGGAGADTLDGGAGADLLTGRAGNDLFIVDAKATIAEVADGGVDTVRASISFTLTNYVENLELTGTRACVGQGNGGANHITGNSIANTLYGRGGADVLQGAAGGDTLNGGSGSDYLVGGTGADTFLFNPGDGKDTIHDFGAGGEHDVINVSAYFAAGLTAKIVDATAGATISFANGDSIFVQGVHPTSLHATSIGWVF